MSADLLHAILSELNGSTDDIEACAVLSGDGVTMASMLPAGMDEDRVGAMSAAMLSLGERASRELGRGELEQVLVKGHLGCVLMTHAAPGAVLTALCKPNARLGLILLDLKRACDAIGKVL